VLQTRGRGSDASFEAGNIEQWMVGDMHTKGEPRTCSHVRGSPFVCVSPTIRSSMLPGSKLASLGRGPSQQRVEGMTHTRKEPCTGSLESSASVEER